MAATVKQRAKAAALRGQGHSRQRAAEAIGVTRETIRQWELKSPEFLAKVRQAKAQAWNYCDELVRVTGMRLLERAPEEDDLSKLGAVFSHAVKHVVSIDEPVATDERKQYASEDEALRDLAARLTPEQLAKLNEMSAG